MIYPPPGANNLDRDDRPQGLMPGRDREIVMWLVIFAVVATGFLHAAGMSWDVVEQSVFRGGTPDAAAGTDGDSREGSPTTEGAADETSGTPDDFGGESGLGGFPAPTTAPGLATQSRSGFPTQRPAPTSPPYGGPTFGDNGATDLGTGAADDVGASPTPTDRPTPTFVTVTEVFELPETDTPTPTAAGPTPYP